MSMYNDTNGFKHAVTKGKCEFAPFDTQNVLYRCLYFSNITEASTIKCIQPTESPTYTCGGFNCEKILYDNSWDFNGTTQDGSKCTKARVKKTTTTENSRWILRGQSATEAWRPG